MVPRVRIPFTNNLLGQVMLVVAFGLLVGQAISAVLLYQAAEQRIEAFGTAFQYMLVSAAPERESEIQQLKAQHGSCFAFHGSRPENWHSIMRNGSLWGPSHEAMLFDFIYLN